MVLDHTEVKPRRSASTATATVSSYARVQSVSPGRSWALRSPKPSPSLDDSTGRRFEPLRFIYLSAQGKPLNHALAKELAGCKEIAFLCGHYEGVDQRVIDELVTGRSPSGTMC